MQSLEVKAALTPSLRQWQQGLLLCLPGPAFTLESSRNSVCHLLAGVSLDSACTGCGVAKMLVISLTGLEMLIDTYCECQAFQPPALLMP